ncbi:hypothetical protein CFHF_19985 [Caulobacter flavus]|uniref:Uncharacterized protein n=1 Tax=Caulobacter flavus TaxID=1679497 RepID=A0A2N5CPJ9_9CAUL|nr:hypothetical protein [Caulobacter flavus]AYV49684.1 hypothetical protein C1707_21080 [Caulobacter flavus]PLR08879.1 hypothetical protein CFHF_19985 [Caulobacter flavus]
MPNIAAAPAAEIFREPQELLDDAIGVVVDLEDVAARRERLATYAQATRPVIVYRFVFPPGASVIGAAGAPRDAAAQLELLVGLTGGGLVKSHGGLAARIPKLLAARFEAMAGALIADWLVALDLGEDAP